MENGSFDKKEAFDHVMRSFNELSDLDNTMSKEYLGIIDSFGKERREMFKYVGTIAGAAAALSPQIFIDGKNINSSYFFAGVSFLIIVLIISTLYVMSSVENSGAETAIGFREQSEKIQKLKNIAMKFLSSPGNENDFLEYGKSLGKINDDLLAKEEEKQKKENAKKNNFYQGLDYASEFVLLFFVFGISLLILSIINAPIKTNHLFYYGIIIFILLNLMSTFQKRLFVLLGFPVDIIKASFRWLRKKNNDR